MRRSMTVGPRAHLVPMAAFAEGICATTTSDTLQSDDTDKAYVKGLGVTVVGPTPEDGCVNVLAPDIAGTPLKVFLHPVTFKVHEAKVDS